jgi:hypothetical protein
LQSTTTTTIAAAQKTVFLEHNRMFEALQLASRSVRDEHPKNLDSPWSHQFVDEIELGEHYSLQGKLTRAAKVIYSFEARDKLTRCSTRSLRTSAMRTTSTTISRHPSSAFSTVAAFQRS